ncbi:MAG: DUF2286 domain-containing protein [Desulfurococcales archaeon]|nr:DUF2286 domain-containing protein [Desulfurococcales archaeon]
MAAKYKTLVVRAERGSSAESRLVDERFSVVVKDTARRALEEWNPLKSDFTAIRDDRDVEIDLPLKNPKLYDILKNLNLAKISEDKAVFTLPVYVISYDSEWLSTEDYVDNRVYIVSIYVDDEIKRLVEQVALDLVSKEPGEEEELEGIEE